MKKTGTNEPIPVTKEIFPHENLRKFLEFKSLADSCLESQQSK
jgi:hypothetical protein